MPCKIHKFAPLDNNPDTSLFDEIERSINDNIPPLFENMFIDADDALFRLAELAQSNDAQNRHFDAMRTLRQEQKNISQAFLSELKSYLVDKNSAAISANKKHEDDELSLIEQDDMEEILALSAMHTKAMNLFGDSVNHLEARLEILATKTGRDIDQYALQPKNLCRAFQNALSEIKLDYKNKLIIYKIFDHQVCCELELFYTDLNNILIKQGILPKIKSNSIARKKLSSATLRNSETVDTIQPDDINIRELSAYNNLINQPDIQHGYIGRSSLQPQTIIDHVITDFIHTGSKSLNSSSTHAEHNASTQYFKRNDVLNALSKLQKSSESDSNNNFGQRTPQLKKDILHAINSSQGMAITKQVNIVDEKTIEFIEMIFNVISQDYNITEVIKNLLLRLQIPVIKVAMIDEDLFKNSNHPARQLLNLIVSSGKGINSKEDALYEILETVVSDLLKEFSTNESSFHIAIEHINLALASDQNMFFDNERNTQKQELQKHARKAVLAEMKFRLKDKDLPRSIHPLILKLWSTLMFHRYIKFGRDSMPWQESCNLLSLLINSVQTITTKSSWLSLNTNSGLLINTLESYLLETKLDNKQVNASLQSLKERYHSMIKNSEFNIVTLENEAVQSPEEQNLSQESHPCDARSIESALNNTGDFISENSISPNTSKTIEAHALIINLPDEVRPGVWFEVFNGEDKALRRLKLSVIIMDEAKLIFVDRLGKKIIEKDAETFSIELINKQSNIISDHSIFDNALSRVITSLSASA